MQAQTRSRLAWTIATVSIVCVVGVQAAQLVIAGNPDGEIILNILATVTVISWATVGATIAGRTGNRVGWALLAFVATAAVFFVPSGYASYSLDYASSPLPFAAGAALIGTLAFFLMLALIPSIPLLYPTGRPRWRWTWRVYLGALAVLVAGFAILPQDLGTLSSDVGPPNPIAVGSLRAFVDPALTAAGLLIVASGVVGVLSLILRFRSSHGEERQQIRWFAYVGIAALILFFLTVGAATVFGNNPTTDVGRLVSSVLSNLMFATVLLGIPAACGIAILKYHLYDLDVVVRKTVVFGLLALFITAVYAVVVGGVGVLVGSRINTTLSFVAAAILAVGFQPARERARKLADRVVYGKRATPYEVLSAFSEQMSGTFATDDVLPRMAQILAAGTGADRARVWLLVGGTFRTAAAWPDEPSITAAAGADGLPHLEGEDVVEVRHRGDLLGALSVAMPASDPMTPAREKLVEDLAAQAGLVLRNVRLIEDLRASRKRLVAAQDEERRKLERNIHDGAQQQLVALAVQLKLARTMLERDPAVTGTMLETLQGSANDALEDLRDLARGIYPPLLADKGLAAALDAQARKAAVPTEVVAEGLGRYPQEVESAVYFSCLESLNNVAKYAEASSATVTLQQADGHLAFSVTDDGRGFDAGAHGYGTGLQGIADRIDAVGGSFTLVSEPGAGTKVTGRIPVAMPGSEEVGA